LICLYPRLGLDNEILGSRIGAAVGRPIALVAGVVDRLAEPLRMHELSDLKAAIKAGYHHDRLRVALLQGGDQLTDSHDCG
jgi:hypothetical protein